MTHALAPLQRERLARLKAEWELAALRAEIARQALGAAVAAAAGEARISGEIEVDFVNGILVPAPTPRHPQE